MSYYRACLLSKITGTPVILNSVATRFGFSDYSFILLASYRFNDVKGPLLLG